MQELLGGLALADLGAGGFVAIIMLMIIFGWLIPKRQHERELADKDAQIVAKDKTIEVQSGQISELIKANETTIRVIEALPVVTRRGKTT